MRGRREFLPGPRVEVLNGGGTAVHKRRRLRLERPARAQPGGWRDGAPLVIGQAPSWSAFGPAPLIRDQWGRAQKPRISVGLRAARGPGGTIWDHGRGDADAAWPATGWSGLGGAAGRSGAGALGRLWLRCEEVARRRQ